MPLGVYSVLCLLFTNNMALSVIPTGCPSASNPNTGELAFTNLPFNPIEAVHQAQWTAEMWLEICSHPFLRIILIVHNAFTPPRLKIFLMLLECA
jgi:hypothetical protein